MNIQICRNCYWPYVAQDGSPKVCLNCYAATWVLVDVMSARPEPAMHIWLTKNQNYEKTMAAVDRIQRMAAGRRKG